MPPKRTRDRDTLPHGLGGLPTRVTKSVTPADEGLAQQLSPTPPKSEPEIEVEVETEVTEVQEDEIQNATSSKVRGRSVKKGLLPSPPPQIIDTDTP